MSGPAPRNEERPGLYIHVPFCISKCAYCGFYSFTDLSLVPDYLAALRREMAFYREWTASFDTLYIGGGTPSVLPDDELAHLIADLRTAFTITPDAEITVETNPGDVTPILLSSLKRAGINRLNIGIQSFDDDCLKFLGRRHTAAQAREAVRMAREAGFGNIGLDLIYGLPSSSTEGENGDMMPHRVPICSSKADRTFATWLATLNEAVRLHPDHLSCYQLTIE